MIFLSEGNMQNSKVLILLASYNGEKYIRQMIDSILNQDHGNIQLVVSDDNSSDGTLSVLEAYAAEHPDKIIHYRSGLRFGCAQKHFMHLLQKFQDAPYIMFCDQDDVWHSDKISRTLAKMRQLEQNPEIPALVHTDLRVVDQDLCEIAPSFCKHSCLDGNRLALNQVLVQNVVTGCTTMINRSLAVLATRESVQEHMLMHDWWLALLASACGVASFLDVQTIDYRQHSSNSVGAKNVRSFAYLKQRLCSKSMRQSLADAALQAEVFLSCYRDVLSPDKITLLQAFSDTQHASIWKRDRTYIRYKLFKKGTIRIAAQMLGW